MPRKYLAFSLMLVLLALGAAGRPCHAQANNDENARQLVEGLYTSPGTLPVNDMMIMLDVNSSDTRYGGEGILQPSSHDKIFFKRPSKIRVDSVLVDPGGAHDGQQVIIIRDGVNCWMYVSMGEYPVQRKADEPIPPSQLPFNIMQYPQDAARQYESAGQEAVDGVTTEVVRVLNPAYPGMIYTVWIDPSRHVPLKVERQEPNQQGNPGQTDLTTVVYRDIRQMEDGRYMPFALDIYKNQQLVRVVVYKAMDINRGLEDSLFEPMSKFMH